MWRLPLVREMEMLDMVDFSDWQRPGHGHLGWSNLEFILQKPACSRVQAWNV